MEYPTLAFRKLPREHTALDQGCLYWLAIEQESDIRRLARQFLAALPSTQSTTLIAANGMLDAILEPIPSDKGPNRLRLFDIALDAAPLAVRHLLIELKRCIKTKGSLVLMVLPESAWSAIEDDEAASWLRQLSRWLHKSHCTLVIMNHGLSTIFDQDPVRMNAYMAGFATMQRQQGSITYQVQFWRNSLGVSAARTYQLEWHKQSFVGRELGLLDKSALHAPDHDQFLIQRSALQDIPSLSARWLVFEQAETLFNRALNSKAATVILAVNENRQVESLARMARRLRNACGSAIKIVVRELNACLRHRDQQLLLVSGANLIIPARTPGEHFLMLINSIQGQLWFRPASDDMEALMARLQPPQVRGLLQPSEFLAALDRVYETASGDISHQLVELQISNSLKPAQCLGQLSIRRFGDIATLIDGKLYLFLFACSAEGLEAALGNICKLPWTSLFSQRQLFQHPEQLPREIFAHAELPEETTEADPVEHELDSPLEQPARTDLSPRRITLKLNESHDDVFGTA